jgi:rhodanese-related sulfurtransferase
LKAKMDRWEVLVLVDTMQERYYRHSHLPGAINLPVHEVRERAPELLQGRRDHHLLHRPSVNGLRESRP